MPSLAAFVRELLPDWMRRKDGAGATDTSESRPAAPRPSSGGRTDLDKEDGESRR